MLSLAYTGPALGAGIVAAVIGVIGSFALGIFGIVWYPVKRLIRRLKSNRAAAGPDVARAPAPGENR